MKNDILNAVRFQERLANQRGELDDDRRTALDRYFGRPYGDEVEGRSQVVMRDVADTVEWIKPSLLKIFAAGDEVVSFRAFGPEDEPQAEQETDYCNHVLMAKNNGFLVLHDWFHDALVQRNGYVMVQASVKKQANREKYQGLTDDEFQMLMQSEGVELVEHEARPVVQMTTAGPYQATLHDAVIRQVVDYACVEVTNIPPERCLVAADWPGITLEGCPFVEVIDYKSVSELRELGYEVEDTISDQDEMEFSDYAEEIRGITDGDYITRNETDGDPLTRPLRVRYVWIQHDADEDGIAELHRLVIVGSTILEDEEDDIIPVACITPGRLPHEHIGQSVDDWVQDLQRIRTVLTRGYLDNMYLSMHGRNAVDTNRVNIDDLLITRPGGIVRTTGDPSTAIMPMVQAQNGSAILQAIEYVDTVRENRTGVTKYNQGLDANTLNKTATGIQQIMSASQQRIELIARVFAETGVRALMLIIHAMSIKHGRQNEMLKLRNQWVPVDPRGWKTRRDVSVSVGIGTGNKDQQLQHLMMILQEQKQALAAGIATPANVYATLKRLTQNAGFKNADEFWTNPAQQQQQPQQQQPDPQVVKTQMQIEADQQQRQVDMQADAQKMQFTAQMESVEREKDRQAELQKVQIHEQNAMRMKLMELAAGVLSAATTAQAQPVNLADGTRLDQSGQSPGMNVDSLQQIMQAIDGLAQRMGYQ